jgi:hypothetical protein
MSEKKDIKILAMYLPQYHRIPENDQFWGEGFTDWVTVKKAVSLFDGHVQPFEPLDDNYYDLSEKKNIEWQINLAKKYGIFGFGIYHYWFSNEKVLLTKPAEIILANKDLDIPFFFAWDNANWRRSWSRFRGNAWAPLEDKKPQPGGEESSLLIKYELGEKPDWKRHFDFLLPYFLDERYIKVDGKPLFEIFNFSDKIYEMAAYWDELARQNGFAGMHIVYKKSQLYKLPDGVCNFCYEPQYTGWGAAYKQYIFKGLSILGLAKFGPYKYSYDRVWKGILKNAKNRSGSQDWHGAFVAYDDTPRRGKEGRIVDGSSPEKFEKYLSQLIKICRDQAKEYILLTAWNEWGEGATLEPSKAYGYQYIEAVQRALKG